MYDKMIAETFWEVDPYKKQPGDTPDEYYKRREKLDKWEVVCHKFRQHRKWSELNPYYPYQKKWKAKHWNEVRRNELRSIASVFHDAPDSWQLIKGIIEPGTDKYPFRYMDMAHFFRLNNQDGEILGIAWRDEVGPYRKTPRYNIQKDFFIPASYTAYFIDRYKKIHCKEDMFDLLSEFILVREVKGDDEYVYHVPEPYGIIDSYYTRNRKYAKIYGEVSYNRGGMEL